MIKKIGLLILLGINLLHSQKLKYPELNTYLYDLEDKHKLMGNFSIYKDREMVYNMPIGFADPANRQELNKDTKFRIGSISKTFTATLILKAQEEGLLSLDDYLSKYYPEVPHSNQITLKSLLNHTSGLVDFAKKPIDKSLLYKEQTKKNLLDIIIENGKEVTLSQKYRYCNANYILLSFILEEVYRKSYSAILKNKITSPLSLKNTFYGKDIDLENNEAHSFKYIDNWLKQPETRPSVSRGAGSLVSNTSDLTNFMIALFNGELISKESLTLMKPAKKGYGLGMFSIPFGNSVAYGHNGLIDGFKSNLLILPEENIVLCTLFNYISTSDNPIMLNLYRAATEKPIVKSTKKGLLARVENPERYLGVYANETFPLKIAITTQNNQLYAQATGQARFKLDAYANDMFKFDEAKIQMKFLLKEETILFQQGSSRFEFKKEKPVQESSTKRKKKKKKKRLKR
ncbi:serine hydrolase domain-containing protein [Wenyingzhuangia sp. IMCC45533]